MRQAAVSAPAPSSPLQDPTGKLPLPVYSDDRSTLPNFLKIVRTWHLGHVTESIRINEEPIHVVDEESGELDTKYGGQGVSRLISVCSWLVKEIRRDSTLTFAIGSVENVVWHDRRRE